MAMQDQTLATKASRVTLFEQQGSKKCRMFTEKDETVMHITSEYSKLVQAEWRSAMVRSPLWLPGNNKANMVLCLPNTGINWSRPQSANENQDKKFLWDFNTKIDCVVEARRPDIVVINKKN